MKPKPRAMNGAEKRLIDTPLARIASISLSSPSLATTRKMPMKKDAGSEKVR